VAFLYIYHDRGKGFEPSELAPGWGRILHAWGAVGYGFGESVDMLVKSGVVPDDRLLFDVRATRGDKKLPPAMRIAVGPMASEE